MTDESDEPKEKLAECSHCNTLVPERQLVRIYGKELCYSCMVAWFGEDDDEDEDEKPHT
jgi:formylmethanofuran dehydrogenase subunit E